MAKKVLVTAALPYANGPIHLGHLLEAVQTDVYVRARRAMGEDVIFMWADDTHGTPVQVRARREGIEPEALIARAYLEHVADYDAFGIRYDIFHTTHSDENRKHAHAIFNRLRERGDIEVREVEQLYSEADQMFLPDRFVKGTCPNCGAKDQYGDSCESCGATYRPTDLIEPRSVVSGDRPVLKTSEHLMLPLARHEAFLREWLKPVAEGGRTRLQESVRRFVLDWVDKGLRDWDISREAPYFGIEIPGFPGKFFYVWFDAPIGYIAATDKWCQREGKSVDDYWKASLDDVEIVHVIGKDIVYFHCLFWPAMLHAADYTVPSRVHVHGYLSVDGEKMSKSRGTFILAKTFREHVDPSYLRYYLAARLSGTQDDFDFVLDDFVSRVNADLVNKAANLASRAIQFIGTKLGGTLGEVADEAGLALLERARELLREAPELYREFDTAKVMRATMELAEAGNLYLSEREPWKLVKAEPERARSVLTVGVHLSQAIAALLAPVLPEWAAKTQRMLGLERPLVFANAGEWLPAGHALAKYETLAERLDPKRITAMIEASKDDTAADQALGQPAVETPAPAYQVAPLAAEVSIAALEQVDLRVGKILACERVPKADKLLRLTVDLGPLGQRNIFSGIAKSYAPEALVGKHVVVFANLAPRKMKFGVSEGMIMAAGASDDAVTVLELDPRSRPGDKIS
jgi:methionyl-tRNA synthetase